MTIHLLPTAIGGITVLPPDPTVHRHIEEATGGVILGVSLRGAARAGAIPLAIPRCVSQTGATPQALL